MRNVKSAHLSMLIAPFLMNLSLTTTSGSLERVIRDYVATNNLDKIKKIINQLCDDYAFAVHQPHARNGGLIGLAAAAIALGPVYICLLKV